MRNFPLTLIYLEHPGEKKRDIQKHEGQLGTQLPLNTDSMRAVSNFGNVPLKHNLKYLFIF